MNIEQAVEALSFHSGRNENTEDPRWENGFMGCLRPFQNMGLVAENFHDIFKCLRALFSFIQKSERLDKGLVSDMAGILHLGRAWAVHEDGMLRSNDLITKEEAGKIDDWLFCISYAWTMLLDGQDESEVFGEYEELYSGESE